MEPLLVYDSLAVCEFDSVDDGVRLEVAIVAGAVVGREE